MTRKQIQKWLAAYGVPESVIACILSQDDWRYIDARTEQALGQWSGEGEPPVDDATGFALSALYECHDGPHLATCAMGPRHELVDDAVPYALPGARMHDGKTLVTATCPVCNITFDGMTRTSAVEKYELHFRTSSNLENVGR